MIEWKRIDGEIVSGKHKFDCCDVDIDFDDIKLLAYNNWFMRDILPIWESVGLVERLLQSGVDRYLEIGVNCGCSFFWVLMHLVKLEGSAVGIDPYADHSRDRVTTGLKIAEQLFYQNSTTVGLDNFDLIKERSKDALMMMTGDLEYDGSFDLVYVDGSHYGPDALLDMMLAWDLMAEGGIMVVDDFNRQFVNGAKQVRPAAMAFFDVYSNQIEPLFMHQRQIGFIKRASGRRKRK